jgi:hypothetical protein
VIDEGQKSFRSQAAYVSLVAVLIGCALIVVGWNSLPAAGVFGGLGVLWTALTLRSGIDITEDGIRVRGMLHTTKLSWSDTDSFAVVGLAGAERSLMRTSADYLSPNADGSPVLGLSIDAIASEVIAPRVPMFSVVAVVTGSGEMLRVPGTAATPLDPGFPAHAAAELNRVLQQRDSDAGATPAQPAAIG